MEDIWTIKSMLSSGLRRYNPSIEDDGDRIYIYIYGYDEMSRRNQYNIDSEIEAICDARGLCWDVENGDPWCWTIWED